MVIVSQIKQKTTLTRHSRNRRIVMSDVDRLYNDIRKVVCCVANHAHVMTDEEISLVILKYEQYKELRMLSKLHAKKVIWS